MLAHSGVDVSYQTVRAWTVKFGPKIAAKPRRRKLPPSPRWRLDELVSTIAGEHAGIWRAVDDEGEVIWSGAVASSPQARRKLCKALLSKGDSSIRLDQGDGFSTKGLEAH